MIIKKTSTNASASLAGWDFQINAAILHFLDNLKNVKAVRVEGSKEDIELTFNDGKKLYSQAKHFINPEKGNFSSRLKDALGTLNEAAKGNDGVKFTYVTNTFNPFAIASSRWCFFNGGHLEYDELPEACKNKLNQLLDENNYKALDVNLFDIQVIQFYGKDTDNRYKEIRRKLEESLGPLGVRFSSTITSILKFWQRDFFYNATNVDTMLVLSKETLIWVVIVCILEEPEPCDYKKNLTGDDCQYIMKMYGDIINTQACEFQLITKVIADFNCDKDMPSNFIENHWQDYNDITKDLDVADKVKAYIIKTILYKIIIQKDVISNIKREVGLEL